MKIYVAFLRGINVGGHKKVPMTELKILLNKIGLKNVNTYIQSGNVIFQSEIVDVKSLENSIHEAVLNHFSFEVSVMVRNRKELKAIFDSCPFSEEKKVNSYFTMLSSIPDEDLVNKAKEKTYENEEYAIINDTIYFYCAKGYGKAKFSLNYFERNLRVTATARNYKTMVKLLSLSENL